MKVNQRRSLPPSGGTITGFRTTGLLVIVVNRGRAAGHHQQKKRGGQRIADDLLCCVVLGTAKTLNDFKFLRRILIE